MDGRKRTVQLKFRVTEAERDLILEKMKLIPTRNMAAYLRKIAIDGYIIQIDHSDIKAMTAEIINEYNSEYTFHDFRMVKGETHTNLIFDLIIPFCDEKEKAKRFVKAIFDKSREKAFCAPIT